LAWLGIVLVVGCEQPCKDACQRKFAECTKTAQTDEQRSICNQSASACLNKCPQGPQEPQYEVPPDD
jgi:hypothetical protein